MGHRIKTNLVVAIFLILWIGMLLVFEVGMNNIINEHIDKVYDELLPTQSLPNDGLGEARPG